MNKLNLLFLLPVLLLLNACYKDKGNYTYDLPKEPLVTSLDTVYDVFVGDSLIIDPGVQTPNGTAHLKYDWKIAVPEQLSHLSYTGPQLRTVFGLGPKRYFARLTISDTTNGMKYFRDFAIDGKTAFSLGTVVLSEENGAGQLSFIKPDGSVQARLYEAMHREPLPGNPRQLIAVHQAYNPAVTNSYWLLFGEGDNPGVQLDANTMQRKQLLKENFFDAPAALQAGRFQSNFFGVVTGVINGKLYAGTTSTWDQNPLYGKFGLPAPGDYTLADQAIFNFNPGTFSGYYIGYDKVKQQFLRFNLYGSPTFFGTQYDVIGEAFDPKNVGMELLHMEQINGAEVYAFMKAADGKIYELKFSLEFNGPFQITPIHKRLFPEPSLFTAETKITATATGVFYIASGPKVYRYNPLNGELKPLVHSFGDKAVSMVKLIANDQQLVAGTEGSLFYLDIGTGKLGELIRKVDGLPGRPVDLYIRN
ncbi:MAG TPA: PKD-like family lipoprotein [Chitinophagaceae bacterium]|jgi:hypothetical protein|nr:PKD-like family lipoprotein [Chitinophagaceae bacterium]